MNWRIVWADGITRYGTMKCRKCRLYIEPGDFFLFRETHKGFETLHRICTNTEAELWKNKRAELDAKRQDLMRLLNHTEQFNAACGVEIGLEEELQDTADELRHYLEQILKQMNKIFYT